MTVVIFIHQFFAFRIFAQNKTEETILSFTTSKQNNYLINFVAFSV